MKEQELEESQIVRQIKKEMKKRNLSLRELSKLSLVAPSTIYDVLENRGSPRLTTLQDICKAMDMEVKISPRQQYKEDEDLLLSISNLTKAKRRLVKAIILLLDAYDEI